MNKNLFIYSFKYLAVLLALVTFSSCERTEFTEQDAFDLEQARLDAQTAREEAALAAQDKRVMDMAMFRRSMDSLTRLNSGGKVFYTVNVVPGGSTAFSGGRFEEVEGLDGATVTVSQLGGAIVEQKTTVGGLASFEMYSGEVTVNVEAPNHTDVNYVANLTPDGGVPNGALLYVGNVIPVFDDPNNPGAGAENNLATVKGFAFAELDITFGNNFEESVPDGTKVRAFIDVNNAFMDRYIREANDEGVNNGGQPTKSGFVQRIAYEEAVSTVGSTVTSPLNNDTAPDGGEYSISMAATASGLPVTMKFDDFAADRTFVFDDSDGDTQIIFGGGFIGAGTKRYIYTQNTSLATAAAVRQNPTAIPFQGAFDLAQFFSNFVFDFATTEATATAAITGGDAVASVTITDGGFYYEAPTVTFSAPTTGTTATGVAVLENIPAAATGPGVAAARARGLKRVASVTVSTAGSGYTTTPTVTFTRKSFTGRDAAGVPVINGTGEVAAPSSQVKYIRIIDAGFGMNPAVAAGTAVTGVGVYTGTAPKVIFNNNIAPVGGILATANTIVDQVVGTATEIQVTNGGEGYSDANLVVKFGYGSEASVTAVGAVTPALFVVAAGGELRWNSAPASRTVGVGTSNEVQVVGGSNYTFVPSVTLTGLNAPAGATLPTFSATVTNGIVTGIEMVGANTGWGVVGTEFTGTVNIIANPDGVEISATGFTQGGSIDTYDITNYGTTNNVYKMTVETAGQTFNYLTTNANGNGQILNGTGAVMTPADYALNSDYIVVFANPTAADGTNAWGYPIFDNDGSSLVGVLIINQGIGYTNPSPATYGYWVLPADLAANPAAALAQYAGTNSVTDANANGTAVRTANRLTITFTNGGSGYAVRPEFLISGGNKSAEDLAGINTALSNAVRDLLTFNGQGAITNTSVNYTGALPFTAADLVAEPIAVSVSSARLAAVMSTEASDGNGLTPFNGFVEVSAANATNYATDFAYFFSTSTTVAAGAAATETTALNFFDQLEARAYTAEDRQGFGGAARANFQYITAPTVEVQFLGLTTGFTAVAVLNPAADISGLQTVTPGTLPSGLVLDSFFYFGNDPSYPATGERFRTLGGPESFEVFSGVTYIRDANYGTGIELE